MICNSVGESSKAAFRSVRKLWPQLATFCTPLSSAASAPGTEERGGLVGGGVEWMGDCHAMHLCGGLTA